DGRIFFWLGPAGTVTPLHHDMTNNGLAQIVGRKRVKLVAPHYTPVLYNDRHCFSRVDPEAVDLARFPKASAIRVLDVVVEPGEILFIPIGWWHHVRSLETSISISFTHFRAENQFQDGYEGLLGAL